MKSDDGRRLRTPQGTEGVYLEEAYRHRKLLRMTEDFFASWGYHPVLTPVFDYYETYRSLLDNSQLQQSYRFPDRDGELLMLRSDITLFLAKQMGLVLKDGGGSARVYYADSIIRHQEEEDISSDEFFQTGAELIGIEGLEGDMEILMLLQDLLTAMKLPKWRMHIGSRRLIDAVTDNQVDISAVGKLLTLRDFHSLSRLFQDAHLPDSESLARLLFFLGTPKDFESSHERLIADCKDGRKRKRLADAAGDLVSMCKVLAQNSQIDNIRIDLSEYGEQPYYTGFTVKVYVEGVSTAVAAGGRYDTLLGTFGLNLPAAGFSLLTRKVESLSEYCAVPPTGMPVARAEGKDFTQRYIDAVTRRGRGEKVALS